MFPFCNTPDSNVQLVIKLCWNPDNDPFIWISGAWAAKHPKTCRAIGNQKQDQDWRALLYNIHMLTYNIYTFRHVSPCILHIPISHNIKTPDRWRDPHQSSCYNEIFCWEIFGPGVHVDASWHAQPIQTALHTKLRTSWQWHSLMALNLPALD